MSTVGRSSAILVLVSIILSFGSVAAHPVFDLSYGVIPFGALGESHSVVLPIGFGAEAHEIFALNGEMFNIMGRPVRFGESARLFVRGRGGITIVDGESVISVNALLSFYDTTDANARIAYAIAGEPGNRLLTVEWRNGKFIDVDAGEYVTFQLRLYQSGTVEFHYGPNSLQPTYLYPGFAFVSHNIAGSEQDESLYMIVGDPQNPVLYWDTAVAADLFPLDRIPSPGTLYRLTPRPVTSSVYLQSNETVSYVGPNPASDRLIVRIKGGSSGETSMMLVNTVGERVYEKIFFGTDETIDVSTFPDGIYLLTVRQGELSSTHTVVIR